MLVSAREDGETEGREDFSATLISSDNVNLIPDEVIIEVIDSEGNRDGAESDT